MDVALFCRPGPNEELRYALRSMVNVTPTIQNVWIIGDAPDWYTGPLIKGNFYNTKQRNVYDNVRIISTHPGLPSEVVVWNDDFFAMRPGTTVEMAWRCTLAEHIASLRGHGWWRRSLMLTKRYLADHGYYDPLSYELHRPFPIVRKDMASILKYASRSGPNNPPQWRTLYGVMTDAGGVQADDGRVTLNGAWPDSDWLSTVDTSAERVLEVLREALPHPSPWERETDGEAPVHPVRRTRRPRVKVYPL